MKRLKEGSKLLVLDTYALLNVLFKETGHERVVNYLQKAKQGSLTLLLNEINLGECFYRIWKRDGENEAKTGLVHITHLPLTFVPVDQAFILAAASWKGQYAISYADAFVVETAARNKCPILTGDPEFEAISEVEIIRVGK